MKLQKNEQQLPVKKALEVQAASIELSAKGAYTTILNQKKELGEGQTAELIAKVVEVGIKPIKATNKIQGDIELMMFATDFMDKHPTETVEDLAICLKRARQGSFGEIYNRVDGMVIFDWFSKYLDEKLEKKERYLHQAKISASNELEEGLSSVGLKVCESIRERIKAAENDKIESAEQLRIEARRNIINRIMENRSNFSNSEKAKLLNDLKHDPDFYEKEIKTLESELQTD